VRALLPEARVCDAVTGSNWEGTGVVPDIACPPDQALGAHRDAGVPRSRHGDRPRWLRASSAPRVASA